MKRIYLRENSIKSVLNNRLLPKFIFNAVKKHETSLGDNSAFPSGGDYPYDYSLLKTRFNEVCDAIEEFGLENLDEDYLMSELSSSITLCKEMEKPIRDSLEKICENAVNRLFAIPEEILNLKVKLVDKVTFKKAIRLKPESSNDAEYSFEDVADLELSNKAVEKRRFTNALIQGASYLYSNVLGLYIEDIERINRDLIPLYRKIVAINDYLLFTKKEVMSDKNPMQGSYVEVHLSVGGGDGKSSIKAQGIIFPLLLQETIRGLFELFSSHGLPSDMERAQYVIRKADFVLAEPWDMRFGVTLWNKIFGRVEDTNMIPYMFTALIAMDADTFNASIKEILANTKRGQSIVDELIQHAEYDNRYQQFTNRINAKNVDKSLIQDSYFTVTDESGLEIDSDDTESGVIQESEDADALGQYEAEPQKPLEYYQQLVKSATVENIDFIEGNVNGVTEDLIVTINGEIVPRAMILLMAQSVKIRISAEERVPMIQVHIILNEGIQRLGLAPKIYKKLIYTFGAIYSGEGRRINKEHIAKVYAKLAQDPDLYVYHDDMCYIAMRKNGLQEVHKVSKDVITEGGWSSTKKRIVSRTLDILRKNMPWSTDLSAKEIERNIVEEYFHGRKASHPKFRIYEPMIAEILTGELGYPNNPTNKDKIRDLQKVFKYIWLLAKNGENVDIFCKYNDVLGKMQCDNFETLMSKYYDQAKAYDEQMKSNVGNKLEESHYSIHKVDSFEEANEKFSKWSYHGLPLCFTTGRGQWENFTKNGSNTAYVCLKEGWKEIPEEEGENFPYDNYGLSMIWVFVDDEGNLTNCCIRWNHHGENRMTEYQYGGTGADDALTESSISNVLGVPFDSTFIPSEASDFKERVKRIVEKLAAGESGIDHFPNAIQLSSHIFVINIKGKKNFYDMVTNEIVNPNVWFDDFTRFTRTEHQGLLAQVNIGKKINFVNEFGELVSPNLWFDDIDGYIEESFVTPVINNKINIMPIYAEKPRLLLPKWAMKIEEYESEETGEIIYFILFDDGSLYVALADDFENIHNVVDIFNGVVNDDKEAIKLFSALDGNIDRSGIVYVGKYRNVIDFDTKSLKTPFFFSRIEKIGDYYECKYEKFDYNEFGSNILKPNGTFLLDLPFDSLPNNIRTDDNTVFRCYFKYQDETRLNFTKEDGKLVFEGPMTEWPTGYREFDVGMGYRHVLYGISNNGRWNILNDNLDVVWKRPVNEWFDEIDISILDGFMHVTINEKENLINYETGELLIKKEPQDWYYMVVPFKDSEGELVIRVNDGKLENVIFSDGSMLFNEGEGCKHIVYLGENKDTLFITMDYNNGPFNLYDIPSRSYISEWFTDAKLYGENVRFVVNGTEYYYETASKTLTNITDGRQKRLENLTPENINSEQDIFTFIPNKMWRIRMPYLDETRSNVIINNNGHYEYLFDEWYRHIPRPIGNAMCLIKERRGGINYGDIYDISKNQIAFEDVDFVNIDHDDNFIAIKMSDDFSLDDNKYNVVTPQCELLFSEPIYGFAFEGPYIKVTKEVDGDKKYNLFDPSSRNFVLDQYFDYIKWLEKIPTAYLVGIYNPNDVVGYGGNHYSYNLFRNGKLLFEQWYSMIVYQVIINDYVGLVSAPNSKNITINYGNINTGELISDVPTSFKFDISKVEKNGKFNFIDKDLNYLLPNWADKVSEFDSNGYVNVIYGNETYTFKAENGKLVQLDNKLNISIPEDFTWSNYNSIQLVDHKLEYSMIGWRQGQSEHTTVYKQKVVVTTQDGRSAKRIYTQRGDESCKWVMYENYESICRELGIKPVNMD